MPAGWARVIPGNGNKPAFIRFREPANLRPPLWSNSVSRKLKVRIETAGISDEDVARLLRDVARRIDDGRQRGIIERDDRQVGAWSFEDDIIVVKAGGESR
jgi:hypothetical protein